MSNTNLVAVQIGGFLIFPENQPSKNSIKMWPKILGYGVLVVGISAVAFYPDTACDICLAEVPSLIL